MYNLCTVLTLKLLHYVVVLSDV